MRFDEQVRVSRETAQTVCSAENLVGGVRATAECKGLGWLCYSAEGRHYIAMYLEGESVDLDSVFEADKDDILLYSIDPKEVFQ
jgi:hypothetical protein